MKCWGIGTSSPEKAGVSSEPPAILLGIGIRRGDRVGKIGDGEIEHELNIKIAINEKINDEIRCIIISQLLIWSMAYQLWVNY